MSHLINILYIQYAVFSVKTLFDIKNALNDTNGRLADWDIFMVSPCYSWSHVICDHKDGNVISL